MLFVLAGDLCSTENLCLLKCFIAVLPGLAFGTHSVITPTCYDRMVEEAEIENLEFKWGKKRGIGGKKKDVQFYESFTYDGVEYTLYDSVYLYKEEESKPYIGKLIKIWENADKTKRVKVLWFFRPSEISNFLGNDQTPENELFLACGEGVGLTNVNPLVIKLQ